MREGGSGLPGCLETAVRSVKGEDLSRPYAGGGEGRDAGMLSTKLASLMGFSRRCPGSS